MDKPYVPIPMRGKNKVIRTYDEPFTDGTRHAIVTMVDYKDKKGNIQIGYVMFIKWRDL